MLEVYQIIDKIQLMCGRSCNQTQLHIS